MKSKKINAGIETLLSGITASTATLREMGSEVVYSTDDFSSFSFCIDKSLIDFIRDFVNFQRTEQKEYYYNQSDAIREGVELLREKYPNIPVRPQSVRIPTRKGKRTGTMVPVEKRKEKVKTSFYLNESDKEFIYNFIYAHIRENEEYTKEDFLYQLIRVLKDKYGLK